MSSSVFLNIRPSSTGRQIVLFPYLGGFGYSFHQLARALPGDWDVWAANPPGHGPSGLPLRHTLDELLGDYLTALPEVLRPNGIFFGHSMGGVVAYHVMLGMRRIPQFRDRCPSALVLSATTAPHALPVTGCADLPEAQLIQHLRSFGAVPDAFVEDQSLVDFFLPAFRADYRVMEDIRRRPRIAMDVETHLIIGGEDGLTPPGTAEAWQEHVSRMIRVHRLEGEGHMFVLEPSPALIKVMGQFALEGATVPITTKNVTVIPQTVLSQ